MWRCWRFLTSVPLARSCWNETRHQDFLFFLPSIHWFKIGRASNSDCKGEWREKIHSSASPLPKEGGCWGGAGESDWPALARHCKPEALNAPQDQRSSEEGRTGQKKITDHIERLIEVQWMNRLFWYATDWPLFKGPVRKISLIYALCISERIIYSAHSTLLIIMQIKLLLPDFSDYRARLIINRIHNICNKLGIKSQISHTRV